MTPRAEQTCPELVLGIARSLRIPSVAALTGNDRGRRLLPTACVGVDVRFAALLASLPLDGFGHQPFRPERGGASTITWPTMARR
jgi:hypothetical protein